MSPRMWMGLAVVTLVAAACGGPQTVDVTAVEYAFQGIPQTLEAGEISFVLENEGQEPHELGLVRITGEQSTEELIRLPEDEAGQFIEQVPGGTGAGPGGSGRFAVTLEPGRYGYACFVEAPDGEPHALKGMFGEFTVE